MCKGINPFTFMMLAICSAPLQVMLHPVKSMFRILVEYLTLWQMTEIYKPKEISKQCTFDSTGKVFFFCFFSN